ncbi:hypothetical protein [Metabacillus sp. 84]|uniref:hypothetical protein n=1 Tax=Metabacillus sp. 84 TaxID=3404705 RepID=UPI003CE6A415
MSTEHKLQMLQKAIDMGATINVSFHGFEGMQAAVEVMSEFTDRCAQDTGGNSNWLSYEPDRKFKITTFYTKEMSEKIADLERQIAELKSESA